MVVSYLEYSNNLLENVTCSHDLNLAKHDKSTMGEWYVQYEDCEFILSVSKDRGEHICLSLGSKIRHKPRGHMRGPYSMSHLKGYVDGGLDYFVFNNISEEKSWLEENEKRLFDSSLLNSDSLNLWSIEASKRLFDQL